MIFFQIDNVENEYMNMSPPPNYRACYGPENEGNKAIYVGRIGVDIGYIHADVTNVGKKEGFKDWPPIYFNDVTFAYLS